MPVGSHFRRTGIPIHLHQPWKRFQKMDPIPLNIEAFFVSKETEEERGKRKEERGKRRRGKKKESKSTKQYQLILQRYICAGRPTIWLQLYNIILCPFLIELERRGHDTSHLRLMMIWVSIYLLLDYIFECFIYLLFSVFQLVFFEVM